MSKSPNTPVIAKTEEITPIYLSKILNSLKKGEFLEIGRGDDYSVEIYLSYHNPGTGKVERREFRNRLFVNPAIEPVEHSWLPTSAVDYGYTNHSPRIRKFKKNKRRLGRDVELDMMRASLQMEMASRKYSDGEPFFDAGASIGAGASYQMFIIGSLQVFTKADMKPRMYRTGDRGEMIYL